MTHRRKYIGIVGSGCKDQLAVAEGIGNGGGHIAACKVIYRNIRTAVRTQSGDKPFNRSFGVSVNRGVCNNNTVGFDSIRRPCVVQIKIITKILIQYWAVQRTDNTYIKSRRLFQKRLYLPAVLADDTDIVPPCLVRPIFFYIKRTELAKCVCGEKNFFRLLIAYDDLRPMYHRSCDKMQDVCSQRQRVSVRDDCAVFCEILSEKLTHHGKCL